MRGDAGEVIAALGFGRLADARFGSLLVLSSVQSSREAYAFDNHGMMLTQSRYLGDLRQAGRVAADDSGILRVPVRDPGGDIVAGFRPATPEERMALHAARAGVARGRWRRAALSRA